MKIRYAVFLILSLILPHLASAMWPMPGKPRILMPANASFSETLAAREVKRYVWQCTGDLLSINTWDVGAVPRGRGQIIVIARKDRINPGALGALAAGSLATSITALAPQCYLLASLPGNKGLLIAGGDDAGVLYGAYHFAERLGARFYLHGDTLPIEKAHLELDGICDAGRPIFETRGIQPFHDFPEGPDWWNADDYKAILSQLPKLRMNFIGLHNYPGGLYEPAVWVGRPEDVEADGKVTFSAPACWFNTMQDGFAFGYEPRKTSDFLWGSGMMFDRDDYGPDVMRGMTPRPKTIEQANELINRSSELLRDAFTHARRLGIKTCVGTESPLWVPDSVRERSRRMDKMDASPAELAAPMTTTERARFYEGVFTRAAKAYPIDYYWLWTPENWTWVGAKPGEVEATVRDMKAALGAWRNVGAPFQLATCGWTLGPQTDRGLFDRLLPKDAPMSCINRNLGNTPVEKTFALIEGRPKWAIPWMEDDPALLGVQLWAGRMRKDAVDARNYGCTGLMGIHWRTRVLAPNVSALAQAAWEQGDWKRKGLAEEEAIEKKDGPVDGGIAPFPTTTTIANTATPAIYRDVRYGMTRWRLKVPAGGHIE